MESRSQASSPAPRHPAVSPRAAGTMWGSFWNVIRSSTAARSGVNKVSPASARPPPMMSVPGSRRVSAVTRPAGERVDRVLPDPDRRRVAGLDGLRAVRGVRIGVAGGGGPGPGHRGGGGQRLQTPALAAAAVGAVRADHDVADLARVPVGARFDGARDADGPGDAGAQRDEEEAVRAVSGPDPALGEPAGTDVVTEGDRDGSQPLGEQGAQRYVAPAQVRGVHRDALLGVDYAGHGDPGGDGALAEVLLAVGAQFRREREDRLDDRVGAALPAGGPPRLVEEGAVGPDQCGLHSGAAHIEGDDMSHGRQFRPPTPKRSSPLARFVADAYKMMNA